LFRLESLELHHISPGTSSGIDQPTRETQIAVMIDARLRNDQDWPHSANPPEGIARIHTRDTYITTHHTRGPDDRSLGDPHSLNQCGMRTDKGALPDNAATVDTGRRRDVSVCANAGIMFHDSAGVKNAILSDLSAGVYHDTVQDHCATTHVGVTGDDGTGGGYDRQLGLH